MNSARLRRVLALLGTIACAGAAAGAAAPRITPVLVVAVDGLEWSVVLPLLRAGRLPAIADLMRRGQFGSLRGAPPTESPVLWTTIATGKGPEAHGIRGFLHREGESRRLYTSGDRRTRAVWNILSSAGRRVAVVGWWVTYPAEAVRGVMVSQTSTLERNDRTGQGKGTLLGEVPHQVHPPAREAEIMAQVAAARPRFAEEIARIFGGVDRGLTGHERLLWDTSLWSLRADFVYRRVALHLLEDEEPFDFFAVYLGGPDVLGHRFWRYREPGSYADPPSPELVAALGGVLDSYVVEVDRAIAELMAAAGPDVNVIVLSDHGMVAVNQGFAFRPPAGQQFPSGHHLDAPPGVLVAAGPNVRAAAQRSPLANLQRGDVPMLGTNEDVTPTLLALLGVPFGADMAGRPLEGLLSPSFLAAVPPRSIPTYEIERDAGGAPATSDPEHPLSEERLQQLRDLGYID